MTAEKDDVAVLDELYGIIEGRRVAAPEASYTAKLFGQGTAKIGQKLGEEAVETVIASLAGSREELVRESADLIYHLLVLWADRGVRPGDVWRELATRRN